MAEGTVTTEQLAQLERFAPDHAKVVKKALTVVPDEPVKQPPPFTVDLSDLQQRLTVADVEDIETATGLGFHEITSGFARGQVRGMAPLVWVLRRKEDPKFTLKMARSMTLAGLMDLINSTPDEDASPLGTNASPTA